MSRLLLALAAGGVLCLAFPAYGVWLLAPLAVALLALATQGASWGAGFGLGVVAGLVFFVPSLSWSGIFVGTLPWLALAVLQALFVGVAGLVSALGQRTRLSPLVTALAWVLSEALRGRIPYGGFPWVRLAFSQADSPMGRLAALAGAPGVTFAVALAGGLLALVIRYAVRRRHPVRAAGAAAGVAAVIGAGLLVPLPTDGPTARILAIQGNVPRPGLDFNAERRQVLDNHVATTLTALDIGSGSGRAAPRPGRLARERLGHRPHPQPRRQRTDHARDRRRWSAADHRGTALRARPAHLQRHAHVPPRRGAGPDLRQAAPRAVRGVHPEPQLLPALLVRRRPAADGPGRRDRTGHLPVGPAAGPQIAAGASICFEVAYDELVRANVHGGSNLLLVQTNNATFGYSAESEQQLAISRIRAIEHGRSVVHISTVGVSGLIRPDGTVHEQTSLFQAAALADDLPLRDARTLATLVGPWPEYGACLLLLILLVSRNRPTGKDRPPPQPKGPTSPDERPTQPRPDRARGRADPDLQRAGQPRAHRRTGACRHTCGRHPRARRQLAGRHRRRRRPAGRADPHVHVQHRADKQGLGAAYLAGFAWAIERGYDAAVEMDADGSHQPEQLPALLAAAADADLVIGSRWVRGGSVVNWPLHRKVLSVGANIYTKYLLGMPVNDATAGYRVYRTSVLKALDLAAVSSRGYGFQVDMTWALTRGGFRVVEVPIEFVEREVGDSKMSGDIVVEALRNVTREGLQYRAEQVRAAASRAAERRREGRWHHA